MNLKGVFMTNHLFFIYDYTIKRIEVSLTSLCGLWRLSQAKNENLLPLIW